MTSNTLQTIISYLQPALLLFLVAVVASVGVTLYRWRTQNRRKDIIRSLVLVVGLGASFGSLWWCADYEYIVRMEEGRAVRYAESSFLNVGDPAPSFVLTDVDGNQFSLNNARGKVVLINFFATSCGPCKLELPHLEQLVGERGQNEAFDAIVIGREETMDAVRQFRNEHHLSLRMAPDPDGAIYARFAADTIPRTIIVSPDGTIVYSKAEFYERDISAIRKILKRYM